MKQLFIIRHAKSSWANLNQDDFDRPLNERGKSDAPIMAKRLLEKQGKVDLLIASAALRALTTAKYFATVFGVDAKSIQIEKTLYHAAPDSYYPILTSVNAEMQSVAIFAHNPGITQFVNQLTNTQIDDMPTCGIFAVNIYAESWIDFEKAEKSFWFFQSPKQTY